MFQPDLFRGKRILVTGGGSGIGLAIARQFLELGAEVWIASRRAERLAEAGATLKASGTVRSVVMDIREDDSVAAAVARILEEGPLDILINNAGGQFPSPAEDMSPKGFRAVVNNNLNGTFLVTHTVAKRCFIPQRRGIIVNIVANFYRGFPGMAHTGAARAGVDNLTKSLAVEWAPHNIRVNAIAPGIIASSGLEQYPEEFRRRMAGSSPSRRLGTVAEVAAPTLFLATPQAAFITGETIYVDGGQRLWGSLWEVPEFDPESFDSENLDEPKN